jgi:hypothetical protein
MCTPEADVEELLNMVLPFAKQMLEKYGEFFPYGGVMKPSGEITPVTVHDGERLLPNLEKTIFLLANFAFANFSPLKGEYASLFA